MERNRGILLPLLLSGLYPVSKEEALMEKMNGVYVNREEKLLLYLKPNSYRAVEADSVFAFPLGDSLWDDFEQTKLDGRKRTLFANSTIDKPPLPPLPISFHFSKDGKEVDFLNVWKDTKTYEYLGSWEDRDDFLLQEVSRLNGVEFEDTLAGYIQSMPFLARRGTAYDLESDVRYVVDDPDVQEILAKYVMQDGRWQELNVILELNLHYLSVALLHPQQKNLFIGVPMMDGVMYYGGYVDGRMLNLPENGERIFLEPHPKYLLEQSTPPAEPPLQQKPTLPEEPPLPEESIPTTNGRLPIPDNHVQKMEEALAGVWLDETRDMFVSIEGNTWQGDETRLVANGEELVERWKMFDFASTWEVVGTDPEKRHLIIETTFPGREPETIVVGFPIDSYDEWSFYYEEKGPDSIAHMKRLGEEGEVAPAVNAYFRSIGR